MLLCFLASYYLLAKNLEYLNLSPKYAEDMITWAAISGFIGARLFSIISNPAALLNDPIHTIFSSAGFVFYGGLICGTLGIALFLKINKLSFFTMTDIVAPVLALGYAVGRIGCQLSGDGDYGIETTLPWGTSYKYGVVPTELFVHPTPVYESLLSILILLLLTSKSVKSYLGNKGQIFGFYLVLSGIVRFSIEFIRIEDIVYLGLSQAQLISIPLVIAGSILIFIPSKEKSAFNNQSIFNS